MPISNFFIVRILNYIRKETDRSEDDIDTIRFSLEAILWELEKIIYMFLVFLIFGLHWHFLATLIVLMSIRPFTGGFHSSTQWGCLFWTLSGFAVAFFVLPPIIPISDITVILVGLFSVVATLIAAPVRSLQMEEIADKSKDKHKKYQAVIITIFWFVIIFVSQSYFLAVAAMWVIFLQNLQLLIEYYRRKSISDVVG